MKIKTADLTGRLLDWAVAVSLGGTGLCYDTIGTWWITVDGKDRALSSGWSEAQNFNPSTNWRQGGPIIEREWVELHNGSNLHPNLWGACKWGESDAGIPLWEGAGPTPLIAAMRCFVASRLGDEVDVPEELCTP